MKQNALKSQFKYIAVGVAVVCGMAFAQVNVSDQPMPEQDTRIYDVQPIGYDTPDDEKLELLDFDDKVENLDWQFFVTLDFDKKDVHITVDSVDYTILGDTYVELHVSDDTQITRELEAHIHNEIAQYFEKFRIAWIKEQEELAHEAYWESKYEDMVFEAKYGGY